MGYAVTSGIGEMSDCLERIEAMGRAGLCVSVCYGPGTGRGVTWSVTVLSRTGEEFDRPFAAKSFEHAVQIAETECIERGWFAPG